MSGVNSLIAAFRKQTLAKKLNRMFGVKSLIAAFRNPTQFCDRRVGALYKE